MLTNFWLYLRKETEELNEEHEKAAVKAGLTGKMELGLLGNYKPHYGRRFRWTFEVADAEGDEVIKPQFVNCRCRPNIRMQEETELNFLSNKTWIPGKKAAWENVTTTYCDIDDNSDLAIKLYDLTVRNPENYTGILKLYDGIGVLMETWVLENTTLQSLNWGDLDECSSGMIDLECTWKYWEVKYESNDPYTT